MITLFTEVDYVFRSETVAFRTALATNGDSITFGQAVALDRLIRDLNGEFNPSYATENLWGSFAALWPRLGGTATAHKWNLIDLRDLDAAYRTTWYNSPVHSAGGVLFDGATNYGDFHGDLMTINQQSAHMMIYNRLATGVHGSHMGEYAGPYFIASINYSSSNMTNPNTNCVVAYGTVQSATATGAGVLGLHAFSRSDATYWHWYIRGTKVADFSYAAPAGTYNGRYMIIGGIAGGGSSTPVAYGSMQDAFSCIGAGLTASQVGKVSNAVQAYQTALGRAV